MAEGFEEPRGADGRGAALGVDGTGRARDLGAEADAERPRVAGDLLAEGPERRRRGAGVAGHRAGADVETACRVAHREGDHALGEHAAPALAEVRAEGGAAAARLQPHEAAGARRDADRAAAVVRVGQGTTRAATAAALPPLEPPGECAGLQGLRAAPKASGSVVTVRPSSGVLRAADRDEAGAAQLLEEEGVARRAMVRGAERAAPHPERLARLAADRGPSRGRARRAAGRRAAPGPPPRGPRSKRSATRKPSWGSRRSARAIAASTSSRGETWRVRTSSAWAVASRRASSSDTWPPFRREGNTR